MTFAQKEAPWLVEKFFSENKVSNIYTLLYTLLLVLIIVGRIPIKRGPCKRHQKEGKKDRIQRLLKK